MIVYHMHVFVVSYHEINVNNSMNNEAQIDIKFFVFIDVKMYSIV